MSPWYHVILFLVPRCGDLIVTINDWMTTKMNKPEVGSMDAFETNILQF